MLVRRASSRGAASPLRQLGEDDGNEGGREGAGMGVGLREGSLMGNIGYDVK